MTIAISFVCMIGIGVTLWLAYALCRVAGAADDRTEVLVDQMKRAR